MIYGLDKRISDDIGVKVVLAPDIIDCVAKGAGIALDNIDTVTEPTHIFHKKKHTSEIKKEEDILIMKNEPITLTNVEIQKNSSAPLSVFAYRQNR